MQGEVSKRYQLSPFLFFFLLYISVVDVGVLWFQRNLLNHAGVDSWISVGITGISLHLIVWMIYKILDAAGNDKADLVAINRICLGPIVGKILDFIVHLYFLLGAMVMFRSYLSVVQVWLFPTLPIWPVSLTLLILMYYTVRGGLRSVCGLSFWGVWASILCTLPLLFMFYSYLHPLYLTPVWNHSVIEILLSSKSMVLQYLGIESIFVVYPFLHAPAKSQKWAHLALLTGTFIYVVVTLITFMFFSENQLKELIFPTLHIFQVFQIPFFQRIEYLVISIFLISVAANISFSLWMACRMVKRSLNIKQHLCLLIYLLLFFLSSILIKDYDRLQPYIQIYASAGFYFLYLYVPILFVWIQFRNKR